MNSLKLSKRVIGFALSVLFVNAALADATSDARIQAYKANKLIPQNVVLPTSTGAADSDAVVLFNKGALSWSSTTALSASYAPLLEKYGDMTIDELRAAMGPADWTENGWISEVTPERQEIRDYLSLIANNKLKSDNLGSDEALAYLQEQFELILSEQRDSGEGVFQAFPCEGLDFTGMDLANVDLSSCTGIIGEQILSASEIGWATLPAITFSGNESFDEENLYYTDLSRCTGITGEQIMSADEIGWATLPAITFSGNESFNGKELCGTDFSKCTGITGAQIGSATSVYDMCITSAQYNEWKSTLQSKFKDQYVYVDGVRTRIQ